jgi:hypothetical protein
MRDPYPRPYPRRAISRTAPEETIMTATYTFDVFSSLDGFGAAGGDWTGYWGKQGPELLDHRLALYREEQRIVLGATHIGCSRRCWRRAPRTPTYATRGSHR